MVESSFEKMLNDGTFAAVAEYANLIAEAASKENFFGEGRTGGVLTFFEPVSLASAQFSAGELSVEKLALYGKFSLEKPTRGASLGANNSYKTANHNSDEGRYAGAFDIPSIGFWESFSGLDQFDDVVFGAHSLHMSGVISRTQMLIIFKKHGSDTEKILRRRQGKLAEIYGQ